MDYIVATTDDVVGCECPMCRRPVKETDLVSPMCENMCFNCNMYCFIKVSVPFGVAPSAAVKKFTNASRRIDRGGEVLVTTYARRLSLKSNEEVMHRLGIYDNRPCKSYLTMRIQDNIHQGEEGLRVCCAVKDQVSIK